MKSFRLVLISSCDKDYVIGDFLSTHLNSIYIYILPVLTDIWTIQFYPLPLSRLFMHL